MYVVGAQKNCLCEMTLLSTSYVSFWLSGKKSQSFSLKMLIIWMMRLSSATGQGHLGCRLQHNDKAVSSL